MDTQERKPAIRAAWTDVPYSGDNNIGIPDARGDGHEVAAIRGRERLVRVLGYEQ